MKRLLLIALSIIPFLGFSQTTKPIVGFLGVKFGSSKLAVITALKAKGGVLDKQNSKGEDLAFSNITLAFRKASGLRVRFVNNKAYEADFIFAPEAEGKLIAEYNDLMADVTKVYGEGKIKRDFQDPYKEGEGDDDTLIGMSAGKIDFDTTWFDSNKNSVEEEILPSMIITLTYQDDVLAGQAVSKQDAKNKTDL